MKVNRCEIDFKFSKKSSTRILLKLSARAGLGLLETLSDIESRDQFGEMIANVLHSTSAKTVSIEVKISNLLPSKIYVTATGMLRSKQMIQLLQTLGKCLYFITIESS